MNERKTAVITGGSRGIGAATASKLAEMGNNIAIIYAGNREKAEALCCELEEKFAIKAKSYCCDVSDFKNSGETVAKIKDEFGGIDILINNAGITKDGLLPLMKEDDFDRVIEVNLKGCFNMMRHCTPVFLRKRYGRIVNISSVVGIHGNAGQCNYAASKAGIIGLTKSAAKELAAKNILCNAIAPGFIATDMTNVLKDSEEKWIKNIPVGRAGTAEEVAETAVFLVSSNYITGQVIGVDGGMGM